MLLEREIKILNIDVVEADISLAKIGAEFLYESKQKIYTYDVQSVHSRYLDIVKSFNCTDNNLLVEVAKIKLRNLLIEIEDLLSNKELSEICNIYGVMSLSDIALANLPEIINSNYLLNIISKIGINHNKWVRLRETNRKATLTVKHVFNRREDIVQKVMEFEVEVSDFKETNKLLNALGLVKRNYQEKFRRQYKYKDAEISIDTWPKLQPYAEIETNNDAIIVEIIKLCGWENKESVSINTSELYKRNGIDMYQIQELLF
jgi:adenylate cyclase class 2